MVPTRTGRRIPWGLVFVSGNCVAPVIAAATGIDDLDLNYGFAIAG